MAKSSNQNSNTLNQSSFSLPSNSLNESSHNKKQLTSQEQQHLPIALPCSSQLQETSHPMKTYHQRSERNIGMKNIFVGNLWEDITKQDICELFGLNSTSYLSSVKWTVLGHPRPELNKVIFSTKPSGPL